MEAPTEESKPGRRRWLARVRAGLDDVDRVIIFLCVVVTLGALALAAPAGAKAAKGDWPTALSVLGSGLILAGGAMLAGSVIGFLFGVPRRQANGDPGTDYRPNTNLDQVSDWLTKIIIGVGLTQFPRIISFFSTIGTQAGPALGGGPSGKVIAVSATVHFLFVGFIGGFLLAYLWMPGAFQRATARTQPPPKRKND